MSSNVASSSRLSPPLQASFSPPAKLVAELAAARNAELTSDELWQDATESAISWLLSLSPPPASHPSTASNGGSATLKGKAKASEDDMVHWYCGAGGAELCCDSAVFLTRLLSFRAEGEVGEWRALHDRLMISCCNCVREFQRAKTDVVTLYLQVMKSARVVQNFVDRINEKEVAATLDAFQATPFRTLSDLRPTLVQRCLVNPVLFQHPHIRSALSSGLPLHEPLPLSTIVTPGLVAFLFDSSLNLREWAQAQLDLCESATDTQYVNGALGAVYTAILHVIYHRDRGAELDDSKIWIDWADDRRTFWRSLASALSILSPDALRNLVVRGKPTSHDKVDVIKLVASHLDDTDDHLEFVLNAFRTLLEALGSTFWAQDNDKYEEVLLHAVLDNPAFEEAFLRLPSSSPDQAFLDWLPPFLASVAPSRELFTRTMEIVASTFFDRFQKTRFDVGPRTLAIQLAITIFDRVLFEEVSKASSSAVFEPVLVVWPHDREALKVLERYATILAQFAFTAPHATSDWTTAREMVHGFLAKVTAADSKRLVDTVYKLSEYCEDISKRKKAQDQNSKGEKGHGDPIGPPPAAPAALVIAGAVWERSFDLVSPSDTKGVAILVVAASHSAHLDMLSSRSWTHKNAVRHQLKAANVAMETFRTRLIHLLETLADERTDLLFDFLAQPDVADCVATLLFSPVETLHNTAQGIIKQAFDVTTRRECFRTLLFQHPEPALRGITRGIRAFIRSARSLPEVCNMAKRVVRCLSDVIDVFCATRDGLLRDKGFLTRWNSNSLRSKLSTLWKLMCEALAVLFKRTPGWSAFFENEQMTEWMRDAIIFGGDMLDQFTTFELVLTGQSLSATTPTRTSNIGERMIIALNDPLEEVIAWLRLNDEDLLASSFGLVCRMLERFTRAATPVRQTTKDRITKMVDRNKQGDTNALRSSILRDDQLRDLLSVLEGQTVAHQADPKPASKSSDSNVRLSTSKGRIEVIQIDDDDVKPRTSKQSTTKPASRSSSSSSSTLAFTSFNKSHFQSGLTRPISSKAITKPPVPARPRGVPWTEYSSRAPGTSSDDSSDDEERKDGKLVGLAALARTQKSPKIKKAVERRTVKMLETIDPSTAPRGSYPRLDYEKQQAANAARLKGPPDLSRLYRDLLQWDVRHDGRLPPGMDREPIRVTSVFSSPEEYVTAFLPLLVVECWEHIRQALGETANEVTPCQITGRQAVDDFTDVFATIESGNLPSRSWYGETDVVLLRQGTRQTLAKVQAFNRKRDAIEITMRCHLGGDVTQAADRLVPPSQWEIVKICNMATMHREYAALQTLRHLDLCAHILEPRPPPRITPDTRNVQRTMKAYQVNEPQAHAILGSLQTMGFSLIQGPPGTGKTKTILGLIGAFIDSRPRVATAIQVGRPSVAPQPGIVAKVLLCAPSNAAVDEVAKRLKEGIRDSSGQLFQPKVVRIGSDSAVDINVKDIFIDELVEREISGSKGTSNSDAAQAQMAQMRAEIDNLRMERDVKRAEQDLLDKNDALKAELGQEVRAIRSKINDLSQRLDSEKDKAQQALRAHDAQERKVRLQILSDADVICATLSGSGHDYMAQLPFDFETVIIDEATQSIELSSLIPLKYGCRRCILVGDPLQLPPTVISSAAASAGYQRSLFVRMMDRNPNSVHLLSIQYRMHSHISAFPSAAFYNSRLTNGPGMNEKTAQPWHANSLFPPYAFLHVRNGSEVQGKNHSMSNPTEAGIALGIYERLMNDFPDLDFAYRVGVVTPYKGQVDELKRRFRQRFGHDILSKVSFNTVDGFQGQEKDIIILSCVRGGAAERTVGFLKDTRRMNVALTRARSSLFILGDKIKLRSNDHWKDLVDDAEARGLLREVDAGTYRSLTPAVPPVVGRAVVSPGKSKAKSLATASTPVPANLQTPTALAAQSRKSSFSSLSSVGLKRKLTEEVASAVASPEEKKPKRDEMQPTPNPSSALHTNGNLPARPSPSSSSSNANPRTAGLPAKPPVTIRKRPPPSLFMPSKKPGPKK